MYSKIIKLGHGFVLLPIIILFKRKGIFKVLEKPRTFSTLVKLTKTNSGYLFACLSILRVFSIIKKKNNKFYFKKILLVKELNADLLKLYNQNSLNLIKKKKIKILLTKYSKCLLNGWGYKEIDDDILNGPLLLPLIFSLKINKSKYKFKNDIITKIFENKGWLKNEFGSYKLTKSGHYLIDKINIVGVTKSYEKMLFNLQKLLYENPQKYFYLKDGEETHVDRELNISSSSSQHEKYFNQILKIISKIFKKKTKPSLIMDIGCGDGLLLKKIYFHLKTFLKDHEMKNIKVIGVDLNRVSLKSAKKNLKNIPKILIKESIDNPTEIFKKLSEEGIKKDSILQVKSFLDHERNIKFVGSKFKEKNDFLNMADDDIFGINDLGKKIECPEINHSLSHFYRKWSKFIGRHGLINLEVHKQNFENMKNFYDINEGAHFDFLQSCSKQNLVKPEIQLYSMAKNSIFPVSLDLYPLNTNFVRIILGYYKKRNSYINVSFKKQSSKIKIIFNDLSSQSRIFSFKKIKNKIVINTDKKNIRPEIKLFLKFFFKSKIPNANLVLNF